jgi:non-ribosomal peptide synthetase component F
VQSLIGYFLNPVALRMNLAGNPSFIEMLHRSQEVVAGAMANDDVPFECVLKNLNTNSNASCYPLFPWVISLAPAIADLPPGWTQSFMDAQSGGSRWELYLELREGPDGLLGRAQYNPDVFSPATITRVVQEWQRVLEIMVRKPDLRLSGLPATIRAGSTDTLLNRIRRHDPELQALDAFIVPRWFTQQRTWVEDPASSDSAVYNYPLLLHMRGRLNENALQRSLQEVVRRQGALRSVFRLQDRELVQIVVAPRNLAFPTIDLSGPPEIEREVEYRQAALAEAGLPFDLANGPLLRARIIRLSIDDHVLQLTTHHLVCDDWSSGILLRELLGLYEKFSAGTELPAQDLPFQYGDFVRWQEKRFEGTWLDSELSYFRQQFAGSTGFQYVKTDFARPVKPTNRGARETVALSLELSDSLKKLSREERVSLFMVLLTGFQCLLHQESGEREIAIASCAANRPLVEVEGLIGRFGNDMLLRTNFACCRNL